MKASSDKKNSKWVGLYRYALIIRKLRQKPCTFEEINDFLTLESTIKEVDLTVSQRTFQRDITDIFNLFDVSISSKRSLNETHKYLYFIEEDYREVNMRMLEAFDLFQSMRDDATTSAYLSMERKQLLDPTKLKTVIGAIEAGKMLGLTYQKFQDAAPSPDLV